MDTPRQYIAIDLKSFYASVECVERGLNPLTARLVVADESRTDKTICLAVSPALKAYGIGGRARLFEVVQKVGEINRRNPGLNLDYITATPRMALYIKYSTAVYGIYLKYIAPEDILVYSIDEVFIDATAYLKSYGTTAHGLAIKMIRDVLNETGITATAGIGTNMYLAKVAMDIVAKHSPADADGVRIAELDEMSYRRCLWDHKPITDFWRVGRGTAARLETVGIRTMGDVARFSINSEEWLYRTFGVNAELLIDHAWGWEPCTMAAAKAYRPETSSKNCGQVLTRPYTFNEARTVVKEMADQLTMELMELGAASAQFTLTAGFDVECMTRPEIRDAYKGPVSTNYYGKKVPKHAHGTANLEYPTSNLSLITKALLSVYDRQVDKKLLIRRLNVTASNLVSRAEAERMAKAPREISLFSDADIEEERLLQEESRNLKEMNVQRAVMEIKSKFGKNAILKGMNFEDGATAIERNKQIGGHRG